VKEVHIVVGVAAIALNAAVALLGAWRWWRAQQSRTFWPLLRVAQGVVVLQAALGGVLVLLGHKPSGLHVLYGLLPLLVSFLGEQLRLASATMVLDSRGFESSAAVRRLPEDEQRMLALTIIQREMGVMTLAALVIVVLLARAAGT
jgi:heme A synthase